MTSLKDPPQGERVIGNERKREDTLDVVLPRTTPRKILANQKALVTGGNSGIGTAVSAGVGLFRGDRARLRGGCRRGGIGIRT